MEEMFYQAPQLKETETFYKRSMWWISHRDFFRRLGIVSWAVFDGLLIVFFLWTFSDAWIFSKVQDDAALMFLATDPGITESTQTQAAKALRVEGATQVFSGGFGRFDIVARLRNPNTDWWVQAQYRFTFGTDGATSSETAVLYPGDTVVLSALGINTPSAPMQPKLEVQQLTWHRVDPHEVGDFALWRSDRDHFVVSDIAIAPATMIDKTVVTNTHFSITNQSAFGYWNVPLTVLLLRSGQVVAINQTAVLEFEPGTTRAVDLHWLADVPGADAIEIHPSLSLFDHDFYMPLSGAPALDTRTQAE